MSITNSSFELPGTDPGEAGAWTITDDTALMEVAETVRGQGFEDFDRYWTLPRGRNYLSGDYDVSDVWAEITTGTPVLNAGPASEFVSGIVAVVFGNASASNVLVTLTYTNQDGVAGRTATVTIPSGESGIHEYALDMEGTDYGAIDFTGLATAPSISATIELHGSWQRPPQTQGALFVFTTADLSVGQFDTDNGFDGFEFAWSNLGGRRDNFDALVQAAAAFDTTTPEDFEDFEEEWMSNEDYVLTLPHNAGETIDAADFGGPTPNTPDAFNNGWGSTLIATLPDDANGVIDAAGFGGPAPNTPESFDGWTLILP